MINYEELNKEYNKGGPYSLRSLTVVKKPIVMKIDFTALEKNQIIQVARSYDLTPKEYLRLKCLGKI